MSTIEHTSTDDVHKESMEFTLHVSKIDAGIALLLTDDHFLIEFPSILLPDNINAGSIITINVQHNKRAEEGRQEHFETLQRRIMDAYGQAPDTPTFSVTNFKSGSITLVHNPLELHGAHLRSLCVKIDGKVWEHVEVVAEKLKVIVSGLTAKKDYNVAMLLKTSAGKVESDAVAFNSTTGLPPPLSEENKAPAV